MGAATLDVGETAVGDAILREDLADRHDACPSLRELS